MSRFGGGRVGIQSPIPPGTYAETPTPGVPATALVTIGGQTATGTKSHDKLKTKADPVDACHPAFGCDPANADNLAQAQAAIDSLAGARGKVIFSKPGTYTFLGATRLDAKRAILSGLGGPGNSGGGGTVLSFTGTGGIHSTLNDNYGFRVENIDLLGSGIASPTTDNGQLLLDFTGQNYPRCSGVRVRRAGTGVKLTKGVTAVESHYGAFLGLDVNDCFVGIDFPAESTNGSHAFYGGRISTCKTGVKMGAGVNNISFFGTAFECGSGNIGVDSTGTNISFFAVRWETLGTNLLVRSGAGIHYSFGDHFSSGVNYLDENLPSVVRGIGQSSNPAFGTLGGAQNVVENGSFEYDTDANGISDGWVRTASSTSGPVHTRDTVEAQEGTYCQKIDNGASNNERFFQLITCLPNRIHVIRFLAKVGTGTNLIMVGTGAADASFLQATLTSDNAWREYRLAFTPTQAAVGITFQMSGTTNRIMFLDGVAVALGIGAPPAFVARAVTELGGSMFGFLDVSELAADPAAPRINQGRLYTRDNGSGKTQLCVIFNTGAVQVLATQP